MRLYLLAAIAAGLLQAQDAQELVRNYGEYSFDDMTHYSYQVRVQQLSYDKSGKLKGTEVKVLDIGRDREKRTVRILDASGHARSDREALTQASNLDWDFGNTHCPAGNEAADKYDFHLDGTQQLNGRPAWVVSGRMRIVPGVYEVTNEIKIWIDQADNACAKVEGHGSMTRKGPLVGMQSQSTFTLELVRMPDGTWLPEHSASHSSGRASPFHSSHHDWDVLYTNYRKVQDTLEEPRFSRALPAPDVNPGFLRASR